MRTRELNSTEVAIVGGGPVGLSAAVALARQGVRCALFERRAGTSSHPKATILNCRTMELMRQWGLEQEIRAHAASPDSGPVITWMTRLAGRRIGEVKLAGDDPQALLARLAQSPTLPAVCPQDVFEPMLRRRAEATPVAELRFGVEARVVRTEADGVTIDTVSRRDGARGSITARYAIAADGAHGRLRRLLGVASDGALVQGGLLNIHFRAELGPWVGAQPSALYWVLGSELRGVLHYLDGTDRWLLNTTADAHGAPTKERCAALVRAAVGVEELPVEVISAAAWSSTARACETFRAGRVLLAGDAAHEMPPTGGFGMNTGIQDVHNLAWKLAAVLRGDAPEALLDTYTEERAPVAAANIAQSVHNAEQMNAMFFELDDRELRLADGDGARARGLRERIARLIPAQREHYDFQGQDLGFAYAKGALLADGGVAEPPAGGVCDYRPQARPGARAPHLWLRAEGREISVLDLFEQRFTLLTGVDGHGWLDAAREQQGPTAPRVFAIGPGGELADDAGQFLDLYGIGSSGAVLVRPDGHVAFRAHDLPADPHGALHTALAAATARNRGGDGDRDHYTRELIHA